VDTVVFDPNTDIDNICFYLADANVDITSEQLESLIEGIEDEDDFLLNEEKNDIKENIKENIEENIKEKPKTLNRDSKETPKIQQKTTNNIGQNANDPKKELSTEKTRSSEDIYQEILEMVEILGDEKQLLKNFENLKGLELENLKKEMKIYFKEFPEFEEFLTKNLKDSDSLIDLLNKIEKKFPEFKAVFKNSLIQSKMKKLSHENEENEKKRRNSMNN